MAHIVAFTGHMIDRPERAVPRFPPAVEGRVARRIGAELEQLGATDGYASAACGGDLLFHEAMLQRRGKINVVLPCPAPEFREACVDIAPSGDWGARFERVLDKASSVEILSEQCAADNAMASECCNRVIVGLARIEARLLGQAPVVLALWDGHPGDAIGGTHSMVEFCWSQAVPLRLLDELVSHPAATASARPASANRSTGILVARDPSQKLGAMVFADVVKFSKLKERQLPAFTRKYLFEIMKVCERIGAFPLVKNTWGDGLYMVFESVRDAGRFALELCEFVVATDWSAHGLPEDFNVRIGLHAGPVYQVYDPVIGQWTYMGSHVTRAARIGPNTPPGVVYASRTFAALASAEGLTDVVCTYVGDIELAKGYGVFATYRVARE